MKNKIISLLTLLSLMVVASPQLVIAQAAEVCNYATSISTQDPSVDFDSSRADVICLQPEVFRMDIAKNLFEKSDPLENGIAGWQPGETVFFELLFTGSFPAATIDVLDVPDAGLQYVTATSGNVDFTVTEVAGSLDITAGTVSAPVEDGDSIILQFVIADEAKEGELCNYLREPSSTLTPAISDGEECIDIDTVDEQISKSALSIFRPDATSATGFTDVTAAGTILTGDYVVYNINVAGDLPAGGTTAFDVYNPAELAFIANGSAPAGIGTQSTAPTNTGTVPTGGYNFNEYAVATAPTDITVVMQVQ